MAQKKHRIAYFHQDGLITGSAISLRHFLNALDLNRFEPVVILAKEGAARELYENLGIAVYVYPYTAFWTFPGPRCFSRGMLKQLPSILPNSGLRRFILNDIRPNLIHINDKAAMQVGITMRNSGIPIIQHSRSSYHNVNCPLTKFISRTFIQNYSKEIIAISEDEIDGFESVKNLSIINNTVDFVLTDSARAKRSAIRASLGIKDNELLIGFAAAINSKKGAWTFLKLCNHLKNVSNVRFILIGKASKTGHTLLDDGSILKIPCEQYMQQFIAKHGLDKHIIVTGFRNDSLDLMAAMDLLIVPNKNGVLGRQPIEAQALGIPVVAINGHTGNSTVIDNGVTGLLVANENELIEQTEKLIENPIRLKQMSHKGIAYANQHFSPELNIRKIETLYDKLLYEDTTA